MSIINNISEKIESVSRNISEIPLLKKYNIGTGFVKNTILIGAPISLGALAYLFFSGGGVDCNGASAKTSLFELAKKRHYMEAFIVNNSGRTVETVCREDKGCSEQENEILDLTNSIRSVIDVCNSIKPAGNGPSSASFDTCPSLDWIVDERSNPEQWAKEFENSVISVPGSMGFNYVESQRKIHLKENLLPLIFQFDSKNAKFKETSNALWKSAVEKSVKDLRYSANNIITKYVDPTTGSKLCSANLEADMGDWGSAKQEVTYSVEKNADGEIYVSL